MARPRRKGFAFTAGTYYFQIKAKPNNITISRKEESEAKDRFEHYESVGKKAEWMGMWNGKKFEI